MHAVFDHCYAVDDHVGDAGRMLPRLTKCRAVVDCARIKHGDIGGSAGSEYAPVRQAQRSGWTTGHLVDGLRESEQLEFAYVMAENAGERAVVARVRQVVSQRA